MELNASLSDPRSLKTPLEIASALGAEIKLCRVMHGLTQVEAAKRSGVSYRTWRRLESDGQASIDDLIRAAFALRCEQNFHGLFPAPIARSMDELLERQRLEAKRNRWPTRAPRTKSTG